MSAVCKSHSSWDKRWPRVTQRASSWITLILDIWVAAAWLFTRRWCCAPTLWVQIDLGLFHSGHVFSFFLFAFQMHMACFQTGFKEFCSTVPHKMCFCGHSHSSVASWNGIFFSTVWFSGSKLEHAALLVCGYLFTAEANCCSILQFWEFSLKPILAAPTICFEIHREVGNKNKEQNWKNAACLVLGKCNQSLKLGKVDCVQTGPAAS